MADETKPPAENSNDVPHGKPAAQSGGLGDDIAKILKEVKLPERHDGGDIRKPIENKAAVFDTALGAQETKLPGNAPGQNIPAAQTPQVGQKESETVVPVHTLKDDLQHVVQDQKISVVHAVSLEEDRRARQKPDSFATPPNPRSRRIFGILLGALILFLLGVGALFAVYNVAQEHAGSASTTPSNSILFAESSITFPLDNQSPTALKQLLASTIASSQGTLGSITEIIPTVSTTSADGSVQTRPATFAEFMAAIGANPPDELIRALGSNFFFGIHTVDTQAPLFVIPVTSYDHAFAGMLAWEPTIDADLAPIFTAVSMVTKDSNGLPVARTFQDDVKQNYDVRELKDDSGQIDLYYSFPTQSILVIAESPYSFTEILSRLQAAGEL